MSSGFARGEGAAYVSGPQYSSDSITLDQMYTFCGSCIEVEESAGESHNVGAAAVAVNTSQSETAYPPIVLAWS